MAPKGQIYAAPRDSADRHHSSFLAGGPVAGAGELVTGPDGVLKKVTDRSGHYRPEASHTAQVLERLEQQSPGILDGAKFEINRGGHNGGEQKFEGMSKEFLQGGGSESLFKARHGVADEIKNDPVLAARRKKLDGDAEDATKRLDRAGVLKPKEPEKPSYDTISDF